ncbi:MAG: acyl-CoA thioester hydrolase [Clostridia bacterium]|nr:acyl-CoA thioester hydrolase [Clostridia bacterium]
MKTKIYSVKKDGFYGLYFPWDKKYAGDKEQQKQLKENPPKAAIILMLGDSPEDTLAKLGARYMMKQGLNVLTMSPDKKDYGHHNYPLERFEAAIAALKKQGNTKIGIAGASTTAMLSLIAASYFPEDISFTLVFSPSDFVMEGFYQDGLDGARERPGDGTESTVSYRGEPLPFLPFAYRHPEYWQKIAAASKAGGDMIASRPLFDESERRHPLREEEKIKVENIRGHIVFVGAEDDVLWDTCKYIRRMVARLQEKNAPVTYDALLYKYGTHFAFPASLLTSLLPVGITPLFGLVFRSARRHPLACKKTREDLDEKLPEIIAAWLKA